MAQDTEVIVVTQPVDTTEVIVASAVEDAVEEIQEAVKLENDVEKFNGRLDVVENKLDRIIGFIESIDHKTNVIENEVLAIEDNVNLLGAVVVDAVVTEPETTPEEEAAAIADAIEEIENDNIQHEGVIEEVLDTNDVIDAIAPEVKKERRRTRYI